MLTLTYNRIDRSKQHPAYGAAYEIVTLRIAADGSIDESAEAVQGNATEAYNRYAYVVASETAPEPTEAQRALVAKWYLDSASTDCEFRISQSICLWAFKDLTPDVVSARYGTGKKIILNR